jgi:hypothetical protein
MNAKEELLEELLRALNKKPNVLCAHIDVLSKTSYSIDKKLNLPIDYTPEMWDQFLKQLDFQYDNGYGTQNIEGTIWFVNGDWLERSEYDGSEWWQYKTCPEIPNYLKPKSK